VCLITENQTYAKKIARRLYFGSREHEISLEDLESEALLALVVAAKRFKPEMGVKFQTFSFMVIRGRVINAINKSAKAGARAQTGSGEEIKVAKETVSEELGLRTYPNGEIAYLVPRPQDEEVDWRVRIEKIKKVKKLLSKEDNSLLNKHFGKGETLTLIAKEEGLSPSGMSRRFKRVLERVREEVK